MKKSDIKVGDVLYCNDGYAVIVRKDKRCGCLYGQLVCSPKDKLAKIPYALNNGVGYVKIKEIIYGR